MKTLFLSSSKAGKAFMIACLSVIILFASCSKKYDPTPEPIGDLSFRAINTVDGSQSQDLSVNGTVKVSALAYPNASPYFIMTSGSSTIGFYNTGTTTPLNAGGQVMLPIGVKVSTFMIKDADGNIGAILADDGTSAPTTGKVKVKFINLNSALIGAFAVTVDGATGSALIPAIAYATPSRYFEVDPGTKFNFTATGVTPAAAFDGSLAADKIYTIWIDGGTDATTAATHLVGHLLADN